MDMASISAGISAAKTAKDLIASLIKTGDAQKILAATSELQAQLAQITEDLLTAQIERGDLWNKYQAALREKDELAKSKLERAKYALVELAPQNFALKFNPDLVEQRADGSGTDVVEPVHYICQPCMDIRSQRVILRQSGNVMPITLNCHECKQKIVTGWQGRSLMPQSASTTKPWF